MVGSDLSGLTVGEYKLLDLSGLTVGEYKLLEKIGEGGYGAVYRCEQLSLDRKVVVKVLLQLWSNEAQQRFLQEAKLASRLRSTYAATVFTAGVTDDGIAWIAMELIEGITLDAYLRNGLDPISWTPRYAAIPC